MSVLIFLKWVLMGAGALAAVFLVLMLYIGITLVIQGKRAGGASLVQAWRELFWEIRPGFLKSEEPPVRNTPWGDKIKP